MSQPENIIPERVGFDALNRILIAYLKAGAYEKAVSYRDAATRSGVHYTQVSPNNKFFVAANFLTEETRGSFRLTENAIKYTQMLDWGRIEEAKEPLREILKGYGLINTVLDFVSINKKVSKDEIITKIVSVAGVPRVQRYEIGINALIDMLIFSGLIKEEEGLYVYVEKPPIVPTKPVLEKPVVPPIKPFEKEIPVTKIGLPFTVSIMIDSNTDVQKIKEAIRAIKEALQE